MATERQVDGLELVVQPLDLQLISGTSLKYTAILGIT
jgi:hypothetical protein